MKEYYDVLSRTVEPTIIDYKETYNRDFVKKFNLPTIGAPKRIVVHRTGNPRATGKANCDYFWNTGNALSHVVIEETTVYKLVEPDILAWHVNSPHSRKKALAMGIDIDHPKWSKQRADFYSYGIETDEDYDENGDKIWTEDTYLTLITLLANIIEGRYPSMQGLAIDDIYGHSEFDSTTRPHDPDGIVTPTRIREDVATLINHRSGTISKAVRHLKPLPNRTVEDEGIIGEVAKLKRRVANLERLTKSGIGAMMTHHHDPNRENLPAWKNKDENLKGDSG